MTAKEREELLTDVLDCVEDWFTDCCGEGGYDSFQSRVRDMQAMAGHANDPMVDNCIDIIGYQFDVDLDEEFRDEIEDKLAELAENEI